MRTKLEHEGCEILEGIYTESEINEILSNIESKGLTGKFGVREFLFDNPDICNSIFTPRLRQIISGISPDCTKSIKSIYFDKPPTANWIVNWHQDLTINLSNHEDAEGFNNWRKKDGRVVVQPNLELLESIFTIRIHLDDCTQENGALRVIKKSHIRGIVDVKEWVRSEYKETICEVKRGGVLMMKPLIMHSSRRSENDQSRRVIHIEFTDASLPAGLKWKERVEV